MWRLAWEAGRPLFWTEHSCPAVVQTVPGLQLGMSWYNETCVFRRCWTRGFHQLQLSSVLRPTFPGYCSLHGWGGVCPLGDLAMPGLVPWYCPHWEPSRLPSTHTDLSVLPDSDLFYVRSPVPSAFVCSMPSQIAVTVSWRWFHVAERVCVPC